MDDKGGYLGGKKIDAGDAGNMKCAHIAFLHARLDFMAEYG